MKAFQPLKILSLPRLEAATLVCGGGVSQNPVKTIPLNLRRSALRNQTQFPISGILNRSAGRCVRGQPRPARVWNFSR